LKGCPLKCPWCSNPESRSTKPDLLFDQRLCHRFGDCLQASKGALTTENDKLIIADKGKVNIDDLRDVCMARALTVAGDYKSIDEIIEVIEKDLPFYTDSEGGVTLTGGEPFMQHRQLLKLVQELHRTNINITVETSLHEPWNKVKDFVPYIDCWLADIKHVNPVKFKEFTGGNVAMVMDNFRELSALDAPVIARVPVIPDFNDSFTEMRQIIDFVASLKTIKEIHFMPYHAMGESKYQLLQKPYRYAGSRKIDPIELEKYGAYALSNKLTYNIGG